MSISDVLILIRGKPPELSVMKYFNNQTSRVRDSLQIWYNRSSWMKLDSLTPAPTNYNTYTSTVLFNLSCIILRTDILFQRGGFGYIRATLSLFSAQASPRVSIKGVTPDNRPNASPIFVKLWPHSFCLSTTPPRPASALYSLDCPTLVKSRPRTWLFLDHFIMAAEWNGYH